MLRKTSLAVAAVLTLAACGGGPSSYTLRSDLCEVLDYQAFSRWFGEMQPYSGDSVGTAKVACVRHGDGPSGNNVTTRVEAFKYESPEETKQIFDRFAKSQSNMEGKLKADVDDVRYYDGNAVLVLDRDLYLKVTVAPEAVDDSSFRGELPRLTIDLTDQVLERLREKS